MFKIIILLLAGLIIGETYPTGLEPLYFQPFVTDGIGLLLTVAYLAAGYWLAARYFRKITAALSPTTTVITQYQRAVLAYHLFLPVIYAGEIYLLHWPLLVRYTLGLGNLIFLTKFLVLLPFLLTYILSLLPFYKMDCHLRQSRWNAGEYLLFQVRSYFLIVLTPLLVFLLFDDLVSYWPALSRLVFVYPFTGWLMPLGLMFLMYLTAPFFLRIVWGLRDLPAGPLKDRLRELAEKAGVRVGRILIWPVGRGRMANALVIGLLPRWRYVIFTDTLLNNLDEEEIAAVFGHEIGHARQGHLLIYLLLMLSYAGLTITLAETLMPVLGEDNPLVVTSLLLFMAFYWLVIFGTISRQLEHQADLFGALITRNFAGFIRALEKIAALNAIRPTQRSLQHPPISRRVNFLASAEQSAAVRQQFISSLKRWAYVITGMLVFAGLGCFWVIHKELAQAPELTREFTRQQQIKNMSDRTSHLLAEKNYVEAVKLEEQLIRSAPREPLYHIWLGETLDKLSGGFAEKAQTAYRTAWSLNPKDPLLRMYLNDKLNRP